PFRGKTNTPAWVAYVADTVAALRGVTVEELNAQVGENFARLTAPRAA
ncbi:MAG TPA: hypothetical protein DCM87_20920, partial [Planctomycetes bacterium]|nr:hypothetical protein [Planctomycetota bacterium]